MTTFIDARTNEWDLSLDMGLVKTLEGELDLDIRDLLKNRFQGLSDLLADPSRFIDVVWLLVAEQAEERGIEMLDFLKSIDGKAYEAANWAFIDSLVNFCPDPARSGLRMMVAKMKTASNVAKELLEKEAEEMDLEEIIRGQFGKSA